jgi:hypothetical protein
MFKLYAQLVFHKLTHPRDKVWFVTLGTDECRQTVLMIKPAKKWF